MLALQDVTFAYRQATEPVIEGLTHAFPRGSLTVITGASGRGKSTLLYLLALMLRPDRGSITYFGRPVSRLPDGERSALRSAVVGFVFQDAVLDPARTIFGNVLEGGMYGSWEGGLIDANARRLLHEFDVRHRLHHRPGEVSGGQAQRVALCRALVKDPPLILADEPTGNLDDEAAAVVWDALGAAAMGGATVVVATHNPPAGGHVDERLVLS